MISNGAFRDSGAGGGDDISSQAGGLGHGLSGAGGVGGGGKKGSQT